MVDRPHLPARAALAAALVLAVTACGSPDAEGPTVPVVDAEDADGGAGDGADEGPDGATDGEAVADASPVDLATFEAIDLAGWQAIAADPAAASGRQVVLFTVVGQVFSSTGPGTFQGQVATSQPATPTEGTGALLRAEPATLVDDVAVGDVLRVYAEVSGAFGGSAGTTNVTPELTVRAVEEVGYRDLRADVTLGAATRASSGVSVPVTVSNSGDRPMDYRVDVVALNADGTQQLGAVTARVTFVAPGQAAIAEARFPPTLTRDAVISVAAVDRAPAA
jgi:hypothetical protein